MLLHMLLAYLVVLFAAIKAAEAYLPRFEARKITHGLSGVVLLLIPEPVSWLSQFLIIAFCGFVIWREYAKNTASAIPVIYVTVPTVSDSSTSDSNSCDDEKKVAGETVAAMIDGFRSRAKRVDLGITLFAVMATITPLLGISYRWMIPLFFGDPAAAIVGRMVKPPRGDKSVAGSIAFVFASVAGIASYQALAPSRSVTEGPLGIAILAIVPIFGALIEYVSGRYDNMMLTVYGWLTAWTESWCSSGKTNYYGTHDTNAIGAVMLAGIVTTAGAFLLNRFSSKLSKHLG